MRDGLHGGPRYPMGPEAHQLQSQHQQQHPYVGPTHGPSLGPRPVALQPGPPSEASMYPARHRLEGHTVHPLANRYPSPEGPPQHKYPGFGSPGMGMPNMWPGMNHQRQERPHGPHMHDPNMAAQHHYNKGGLPPPLGQKPWPEPAMGYPHLPPPNAQYRMPTAVSSLGGASTHPAPHPDSGRPRLASMLESPEMLALQQLSASSGPPAGAPPRQHMGSFQQPKPGPPSGLGSAPAYAPQPPPPPPEVQLLRPARDNGPDRPPPQQTDPPPKGTPVTTHYPHWLWMHLFHQRVSSEEFGVFLVLNTATLIITKCCFFFFSHGHVISVFAPVPKQQAFVFMSYSCTNIVILVAYSILHS